MVADGIRHFLYLSGFFAYSFAGPPVWTNCPNSSVVYTDPGADNATVPWEEPIATDDATPTKDLIIIILPEDIEIDKVFEIGTTEVAYNAIDNEMPPLTATCRFSITVIDNESPSVDGCPLDVVKTTEPGLPSRVVVWDDPTVTDNSGTFTRTKTHTSGSTFGIGTITVTLTFTDPSGNSEECTFTVTINDEEPPATSNCPTVDPQVTSVSATNTNVAWDEPTFTDNSGDPPTVTKTADPGSLFNVGDTIVTYTAEDSSGNQAFCIFRVTVVQDSTNNDCVCPSSGVSLAVGMAFLGFFIGIITTGILFLMVAKTRARNKQVSNGTQGNQMVPDYMTYNAESDQQNQVYQNLQKNDDDQKCYVNVKTKKR